MRAFLRMADQFRIVRVIGCFRIMTGIKSTHVVFFGDTNSSFVTWMMTYFLNIQLVQSALVYAQTEQWVDALLHAKHNSAKSGMFFINIFASSPFLEAFFSSPSKQICA